MKESVLKTKSRAFALRIVMMYKYLCEVKKEYVISSRYCVAAQVSAQISRRHFMPKAMLIL